MSTAVTTRPPATPRTSEPGRRRVVAPTGRRRSVETIIFVLSGLCVWAVLYVGVLSTFQHGHVQAQLYAQFRSDLAAGTVPATAPIVHGYPVAMLDSAALGLTREIVVEGTRPTDLERGPGHAVGTVLPGQVGTSVLMGRTLSFGGPFRNVAGLPIGAHVQVTTGQGRFDYVVQSRRNDGDTFSAPKVGTSRLTLMALSGSRWAPDRTVFVDLDLVGKPVAAGAVDAPDRAGSPMARDLSTGTVAEFVLSLQLLLIVIIAFAWGARRWSRVGAWVCGMPSLIAALWLVGTFATRMALPNLL